VLEVPSKKRVCKTTVTKTYALNEKDIADMEYDLADNPRFPSRAPMLLFSERQIRLKALEKYGSSEGVQTELDKRQAARDKRKLKKEQAVTDRKAALVAALQAKGLTLRFDSKLCTAFITNNAEALSLPDTVDTMYRMHAIYRHSNIEELWEDARESGYWADRDEVEWDAYANFKSAKNDYDALSDEVKAVMEKCSCGLPIALQGKTAQSKRQKTKSATHDVNAILS